MPSSDRAKPRKTRSVRDGSAKTRAPAKGVELGSEDRWLEELSRTRADLRAEARAKIGVHGDTATERFRAVAQRHGLSHYPLIALGLLSLADTFQSHAFTTLSPEMSRTLGISVGAIAGARALSGLAGAVAPLPMAALTQRRPRRALLCIVTGLAWSLVTLYTGFVTSLFALIAVLCLDGLTSGSVIALHTPLVVDSYHPSVRVRALSVYQAFHTFGGVISPLLVGLLAGILGFTWRGVFLALGATSLAMTLSSVGLRDPGFGKWDTEQIREHVRESHGKTRVTLKADDVTLGFWEISRRVLLIPTNRRVMAGFTVFGVLVVPYLTFLSFFLDRKWNLAPGPRGLFFAYGAALQAGALIVYGARAERQFRQSPDRVLRTAGALLAVAMVFIALGGLSPNFGAMLAFFGAAACLLGTVAPALGISLMSIIPAHMRPHAQALGAVFIAIGGLVGALFFNGIDRRFGTTGTMLAVAVPGVLGALVIASAAKFVNADLDRMIDAVIEDEKIKRIQQSGGHLPMLACRGIDFSYGSIQVLFGVDFTVDDGEMVALLGTNGAGKSTLLKVISGIGLPESGTIRYRGQEITYLDAERRLRLGIVQVPGGRAVFGPLTVAENLRSFGFTLGRDRQALDSSVERCFDVFPRLGERRNQRASTLSGGEQQMLALSKALIISPRLLVIDELSLGLAPVIVEELLDMVREINASGTAVVLVEQSVNIALNLVDHAYFMEKGEIRFDGRSRDLLAREDLLRAVFLRGAEAETDT